MPHLPRLRLCRLHGRTSSVECATFSVLAPARLLPRPSSNKPHHTTPSSPLCIRCLLQYRPRSPASSARRPPHRLLIPPRRFRRTCCTGTSSSMASSLISQYSVMASWPLQRVVLSCWWPLAQRTPGGGYSRRGQSQSQALLCWITSALALALLCWRLLCPRPRLRYPLC